MYSKPFVVAVKKGNHISFKPKNIYASLLLKEIKEILQVDCIKSTKFFINLSSSDMGQVIDNRIDPSFKVQIYKIINTLLNGEGKFVAAPEINEKAVIDAIKECSLYKVLTSYEISLDFDSSLVNYIIKEAKRQKLENTSYPSTQVITELPLYDRCTVGTNLLCIKDFVLEGKKHPIFKAGYRYMVLETGDEIDKIVINTTPVYTGQVIQMVGNGSKHTWTPFDPSMEEWFDDTVDIQAANKNNIRLTYPDRIQQMQSKLDKLDLKLYDHVKADVVSQALHRGVMNCYLPRLAKTSNSIATAELMGSKRVGILTTKNIRIFWEKEFKRLGMKNYVMVNKLADLKKPGKYFIMTYNWIRSQSDTTEKLRKNHTNYLNKAFKETSKKVGKKSVVTRIALTNLCPHCNEAMTRPILQQDDKGNKFTEWTESKGFMCKNPKCIPITNNKRAKGAAWHSKTPIKHKAGSYVDVYLAKHANCDESAIKGRICQSCKVTDGSYKPYTYKRIKNEFSCIIADEIHNAKSRDTQTAQALYNMRAKRRIGLTGTPMSNSAMDVYYPFNWVFNGLTTMFPYDGKEGAKEFENKYCQHVYLDKPTGEKDEKGVEIIKTVRKRIPFLANPNEFWSFIGSKVVRRTYSDPLYQQSLVNAGQKLPTVEIKKIICDMHPKQSALMLSALKNFKDQFSEMVKDAETNKKELNEALVISQMSALRTIATSPEKINERLGSEVYTGPNGGGKIANIIHIVKNKVAAGERIVILSDFLDMQKACEDSLKEFNPIRLQTNWDDTQREEAFTNFAEDEKYKVFIAGTRSVREGVDLSSANSVICCDLLWAPAFQTQAWSRTMAATKDERTCEVFLVISKNSLDEHMFNVFYSKMSAAEQAFDKKVLSRRVQNIDIRFFVDRVLEDVNKLQFEVRDYDDNTIYVPSMNFEAFGERY
jgi:hypothetical protein